MPSGTNRLPSSSCFGSHLRVAVFLNNKTMWDSKKARFICDGVYVAPIIQKVTEKTCNRCGKSYPITYFRRRGKRKKIFFSQFCKECLHKQKHASYMRNREHILAKRKIDATNRPPYSNNSKARSRHGAYKREYEKKWKKENPIKKIGCDLRSRIWNTIRGRKKYSKFRELVGCSDEFLKEYLESLFKGGMSWDNHGCTGWHIDHIKPCASFDLTDPEQQKECFHYTNLQFF